MELITRYKLIGLFTSLKKDNEGEYILYSDYVKIFKNLHNRFNKYYKISSELEEENEHLHGVIKSLKEAIKELTTPKAQKNKDYTEENYFIKRNKFKRFFRLYKINVDLYKHETYYIAVINKLNLSVSINTTTDNITAFHLSKDVEVEEAREYLLYEALHYVYKKSLENNKK